MLHALMGLPPLQAENFKLLLLQPGTWDKDIYLYMSSKWVEEWGKQKHALTAHLDGMDMNKKLIKDVIGFNLITFG